MKPEILAPAGSMEALKAAVYAGADAVYLGGNRFGARAYADNFDETTLIQAIEYAHLYGVKVYLTINTLFRNEEIEELYDYLLPLYVAGLDAVIVQDFGVMCYVHEQFPDLPIHASTQMTITTKYAYHILREYGVTRIVPARELSIAEIADLKSVDYVPEVEVFVQGALCYCYSGQCFMSSMLGGRSGNRGRCAQTCRLPYTLKENDGMIQTEGKYLLSPKDLCGLESIPDLIKAGVDSFKIEGRMKKPEYVAVCVRAYRQLVDAWFEGTFSEEQIIYHKAAMAEVFNRGGFTKGYYKRQNGKDMMSVKNPGNVGVTVGKISAVRKNQVSIQLMQDVQKGDIFVLEHPKGEITLTNNVTGQKGEKIVLNAPKANKLQINQSVRRMSNELLMEEIAPFIAEERKIALKGKIVLREGQNALFELQCVWNDITHNVRQEGSLVEFAANKPLTRDVVRDKVGKLGNTRYLFETLNIEMDDNIFYSLKELKELRRNAIALLENNIISASRRNAVQKIESKCVVVEPEMHVQEHKSQRIEKKCNVLVSNQEQYQAILQYDNVEEVYFDLQYFDWNVLESVLVEHNNLKKAVVLPPVLRKKSMQEAICVINMLDKHNEISIVVRNLDELALLKQMNYTGSIITDYTLYAMNDHAAAFIQHQFDNVRITIPVELNSKQIRGLGYLKNGAELTVYGYQQLMVSAQCLQNTTRRCDGNNHSFLMQDRYLKNFFVFSICKYCYNLIYNGIPTVLYDLVGKELKVPVVNRLHFTKENGKDVTRIMEAFIKEELLSGDRTRGHYNRGVE